MSTTTTTTITNTTSKDTTKWIPGAWAYLFCLNTMLLQAVLFLYMAVTILSRSKPEELDLNGSLALSWLVIAFVIARGALSPSDIVKYESTLVMTIFHILNTIFIIYQYFIINNSNGDINAFIIDLGVSIVLLLTSLYCNKVYRQTIKLTKSKEEDNKTRTTTDKKNNNGVISNKKNNKNITNNTTTA